MQYFMIFQLEMYSFYDIFLDLNLILSTLLNLTEVVSNCNSKITK